MIKPEDLPMSPASVEKTQSTLSPRHALEKDLLLKTLLRHSFNKKKAAEELGISRTTLYSKMGKYEIND